MGGGVEVTVVEAEVAGILALDRGLGAGEGFYFHLGEVLFSSSFTVWVLMLVLLLTYK